MTNEAKEGDSDAPAAIKIPANPGAAHCQRQLNMASFLKEIRVLLEPYILYEILRASE